MEKNQNKDKDQISALISLLEDPDRNIFEQVAKELRNIGQPVISTLENSWEEASDPLMQKRIEDLIREIRLDNLLKDFEFWLSLDHPDFLQGLYLINRFLYPGVEFSTIEQKLDRMKQDIKIEINEFLTPLEKVKILSHIIYSVHNFKGDAEQFNHPNSYFLSYLLDTKKGNSTSLGILYLLLANEFDIPIFGVNLPHHFILAYVDVDKQNLMLFDQSEEEKVLFYINPFNEGAIFTEKEINIYLEKLNIQKDPYTDSFNDKYFSPIESIEVIKMLLSQLVIAYQSRGEREKMDELEVFIKLIEDKFED